MRTIFGRLMLAFMAVLTVSFLGLGLLISHFLGDFFLRSRINVLLDSGTMVMRLAESPNLGGLGSVPFSLGLVGISRSCRCRIWVVDRTGTLWAASDSGTAPPSLPAKSLGGVFAGNVLIYRTTSGFGQQNVLVGLPWAAGGIVRFAVFLRAANVGREPLIAEAYRELWLAYAISAAAASLLAYLVARRLSAPLHEMSQAAGDIAGGDFKRRVRVGGGDEIGRLAASFNNMAQRLDQIEENRREFLSNVSHELRSPLTSVRGFLQGIMEDAVPSGEERRYLGLAFDEVQRLSRLVRDLLDLSSLETGHFQLSLAPVSLPEVIRRTIAALEPQFTAKNLEPVLHLPDRETQVMADADRVEQILFNLLSNAIRFSPEGGQVEVTFRLTGAAAHVEITDHGPGIAPADLPRIFERFYKADQARTTTRGGTGLGLAITQKLVQAHGGAIWAENLPPPGRGARFVFTIPQGGKSAS